MKNSLFEMKRKIGYAFFPARCPFCDCVIKPSENLCQTCAETVFPEETSVRIREDSSRGLIFLYPYDGRPKEAVRRLKFEGRKDLAVPLARLLGEQVQKSGIDFDLIVPVPMSRRKLRQRGYNQAQVLGEELARLSGIPWRNCLVHKDTKNDQHQLSARERSYWAERTYFGKGEENCRGKRILLIDDVYTTGSTIRACTKCLNEAGAACVFAAVLCKTERKN